MLSNRLLRLAAVLGAVALLAACGTATTSNGSPTKVSGGLGQGASGSAANNPAPASLASGSAANQAAANAVLQARGDQKLIQDASMGVQIKTGSFWDSYNRAVAIAAWSIARGIGGAKHGDYGSANGVREMHGTRVTADEQIQPLDDRRNRLQVDVL